MKQSVQVVMLPTENSSMICKSVIGLHFTENMKSNVPAFTNQHLYITVSQDVEPIKEGDWVYNTVQKTIFKADDLFMKLINNTLKTNRKIIATDDSKLLKEHDDTVPYPKMRSTCIAELQQSFLKEFVANPNGKWEVEYDDINPSLFVNQDNTVNITSVKEKMYSRAEVESLINEFYKDFCEGTGLEDLKDNWIKENL
jgi:hypothetical protein